MSCCDGCIKYLLFFFNLLFSLSGLALIIIGGLLLSNTASFADVVKDVSAGLKIPQIFIIVVGVVIFFIATLGCCGAIRENRCMLITFAICLLSIFIVQLAIGIYVLSHKDDFDGQLEEGLQNLFSKIGNPENKKIFEHMEKTMACCGVRDSTDYVSVLRPIPGSCCEDRSDCRIRPRSYWKVGCAAALKDLKSKAGETLGGVAIGLSLLEVLGAIFALRLASQVRK